MYEYMGVCIVFFFFFKQKTAYEMRISDWSSDVCSSDLHVDDVARAMLLLLGSENAGAFNVGSGVRTTIAELAQLLAERTGAPVVHDDGEGGEDWGFPALNIDRLRALGYRRSEEHTSELQSLMRI